MNSLDIPVAICAIVWIMGMIKMGYDSTQLRFKYVAEIDPTFPLTVTPRDLAIPNQIRLIKRSWRMIFSSYPNNPNVDKYARRVRQDSLGMLGLFISFIVLALVSTAQCLDGIC